MANLTWRTLYGKAYMTNLVWQKLQLLKSRLILVGIANSLDLTERLLPGLEARGCKPRLVAFPTYTRTQISTVLQERLLSLPGPVFAAKALEFCARKVGRIWASCGHFRATLGHVGLLGCMWAAGVLGMCVAAFWAFGLRWGIWGVCAACGCIATKSSSERMAHHPLQNLTAVAGEQVLC